MRLECNRDSQAVAKLAVTLAWILRGPSPAPGRFAAIIGMAKQGRARAVHSGTEARPHRAAFLPLKQETRLRRRDMNDCVGRHSRQIVHCGRFRALDRYQVRRTLVKGTSRTQGAVHAKSLIASRYVQRTARYRTYHTRMSTPVNSC